MPQSSFLYKNRSHQETLIYSVYYAPRGRQRLYVLGGQLANRYLTPSDHLIGVIGVEGSGKSTLIKGLFPGLELTNDDEGVNVKPTPIYDFHPDDYFSPHTFHLDVRYELAFKQKYEVVEAIQKVIEDERRVVVEHFDLIYDALGYNAQILFGIGDEVLVARPTVLGPVPASIKSIVETTTKYRKMAHSAEDIITYILATEYKYKRRVLHSDVKHGFVIKFPEKPQIDLKKLEARVKQIIDEDVPIVTPAKDKIKIGDWEMYCTGARTHVKSTGGITDFRIHPDYVYDPIWKEYMMIGMVGKKYLAGIEDMVYFDE
ncbi:MAG: alanine-tRNA synthetase second additional domain-containing protein [Candidatus Rifleibacteriota bacterium]